MPNPKTVARVALAAVAVPGALVGIAAPAANAAEAPAAKTVESHASEAQHTSTADAQKQAVSTLESSQDKMAGHESKAAWGLADSHKQAVSTMQSTAKDVASHKSDLATSHVMDTNSLNGKSVSIPA